MLEKLWTPTFKEQYRLHPQKRTTASILRFENVHTSVRGTVQFLIYFTYWGIESLDP